MKAVVLGVATSAEDIRGVRGLFEEYAGSLGFSLCFQGFDQELAGLPGAYAPPTGRLLLARVDGVAAGCVGLRRIGAGVCEMKRLFVRSPHHGTGLGRRLATAVIDEARRAGYATMKLDTLPSMKAAMALYQSRVSSMNRPSCSSACRDNSWRVAFNWHNEFLEPDLEVEVRPGRALSRPAAAPATGGS